ncbi:MAG: VWA domain-containing protein [Candidatus Schekmanbacteria bacterium]|nr:VWA domain-containing protein [Candidatus Schekmanbacteria bacterium]
MTSACSAPRIEILLVVVMLLVHGGTAARARAQTPEQQAAESPPEAISVVVNTTFVEVPVSVFDRGGEPVPGLGAADFIITDDGVEQRIVAAEAVDLAAPETREVLRRVPAARRNVLFLFDFAFTTLQGVEKAREAALSALDQLADTDHAGVATYASTTGLRIVLSFTRDRVQLRRALVSLGTTIEQRRSDNLGLFSDLIFGSGQDFQRSSLSAQNPEISDEVSAHLADVVNEGQKALRDGYYSEVSSMLRAMDNLGELLDTLKGRKHVLLFSKGFDDTILVGTESTREMHELTENQIRPGSWTRWGDADRMFGSSSIKTNLKEALSRLRRADVVVHTVDTSRLVAGRELQDRDAASSQAVLFMMAENTGGTFSRNSNDLAHSLDRVMSRSRRFYVLGYNASESRGAGAYHRLEVRLAASRRGAKLLFRPGYTEARPFSELSGAQRQLDTAAEIVGGVARQSFELNILTTLLPGSEERALCAVVLELPTIFAGRAADASVRLEVYGYAMTEAGQVLDFFSENVGMSMRDIPAELTPGGLRYYAALQLPPGPATVIAMVRDFRTGASTLQTVALEVPRIAAKGGYAAAVVAADNLRFVVKSNQEAVGPRRFPFIVLGAPFVPVANARIGETPLRVCILTYGMAEAAANGSLSVRASVTPAATTSATAELPTVEIRGRTADPADARRMNLLLAVNRGKAPPGDYELHVELKAADQPAQTTGTRFSVAALDATAPPSVPPLAGGGS